jgi:hypothetical protein
MTIKDIKEKELANAEEIVANANATVAKQMEKLAT